MTSKDPLNVSSYSYTVAVNIFSINSEQDFFVCADYIGFKNLKVV